MGIYHGGIETRRGGCVNSCPLASGGLLALVKQADTNSRNVVGGERGEGKISLLLLPLQTVRANLRLAIPAVSLRAIEALIANLGFARTSSPRLSASVVRSLTAWEHRAV